MERESRPSDSDSTLRSVLSPLRPPVPDVDEQFRNLELNPPDLFPVLIDGDKISKEPSHESCLRAFWKKLGARVRSHAEFRVIYPLGVLNRGTERRGGDEARTPARLKRARLSPLGLERRNERDAMFGAALRVLCITSLVSGASASSWSEQGKLTASDADDLDGTKTHGLGCGRN